MTKTIKSLLILSVVLTPIFVMFMQLVSLSNKDVLLRNKFKQKLDERTAFYDKMWKKINQKGKITLKQDSSFTRNLNVVMTNRKDGEQLMMKWITESNPMSNYTEVSKLYQDLSRTIDAERENFFFQEKYLQDIKLQSDNLLSVFPGGFILRNFFDRDYIIYKPITSDRTDEVLKTGKDNNTEVF